MKRAFSPEKEYLVEIDDSEDNASLELEVDTDTTNTRHPNQCYNEFNQSVKDKNVIR